MQLSKKQKNFSGFLGQFLKPTLKKKMTLRVYVFPKLQTAKCVI